MDAAGEVVLPVGAIAFTQASDTMSSEGAGVVSGGLLYFEESDAMATLGGVSTGYYTAFTAVNGSAWPAPWVTTANATVENNRGRLAPGAAGGAVARAHTTVLSIGNIRVTGSFLINNLSEQYPIIAVRHNGSWNGGIPDAAIVLRIDVPGNDFIVASANAGTYTNITNSTLNWIAGQEYRFTFEVTEGVGLTNIRVKVWRVFAGINETSIWQISTTTTIATRPAVGGVGLSHTSGSSDATSYIEFDDLIIQDYDDGRARVLTVGDEITSGAPNHPNWPAVNTWRRHFFDAYEITSDPLQMVGQNWACTSLGTGNNPSSYAGLGSWDHEHYARVNWQVDDVISNMASMGMDYEPGVAIVYIGGRDLLAAATPTATATKVAGLVTALRAKKADMRFVVCQIAPVPAIPVGDVNAFNAALVTTVLPMSTPTSRVVLADCNTGFVAAWVYDTIHFNDDGDQFVASRIGTAYATALVNPSEGTIAAVDGDDFMVGEGGLGQPAAYTGMSGMVRRQRHVDDRAHGRVGGPVVGPVAVTPPRHPDDRVVEPSDHGDRRR